MSLKRYLFLLVSALILMIFVLSLLVLDFFRDNYKYEVSQQAKQISKRVISFAANEVQYAISGADKQFVLKGKPKVIFAGDSETDIEIIHNGDEEYKIITAKGHSKDHDKGHTHNSKDPDSVDTKVDTKVDKAVNQAVNNAASAADNSTVDDKVKIIEQQTIDDIATQTATETPAEQQVIAAQQFSQLVEQLHEVVIDEQGKEVEKTSNFVYQIKHPQNSGIDNLIEEIMYTLLGLTIIALVFAYWLSHKFNKPLNALAGGFSKLAQGNYQHKVVPQGVDEIKTTIVQFNDMVSRLDALSQAQKKNQQLQQLAELGEVSKGLAHALRNPIHTIGLSVEQLLQNNLSAQDKQQLLARVQSKIVHMNKTIGAMLQLTVQGVSRDQQVPIYAVIQDIILEYKASDDKQLSLAIEGNRELCITGNESEIRSILHTLIINACEASDDNGDIIIKIDNNSDNDTIVVEVQDHGPGVSAHIQANLFNPHTSDKAEGAGMGLYIAKRIITLNYDGDISLVNTDQGCHATVTFGASHA
ncbi:HAMP domain-containing histidine kinase [Thalassotalea sp. HSM 43]|uniref:sensor histidine kinase n=1 Tax=Thalassotalea sp. HSM 43 TaxID=2552945 RepID=UPI0010821D00|nr:HAMP domain-containing sensor histidine kinase [Thalassotalea sp. HSM 43]QBY05892.1 HAMP domain-containing histidine kinase [Thalassotalea sp. HSM 43]